MFAPSARQVTPEQVRAIAAELPPGVERIGVFGADLAEQIARVAETARLTGVQLHGGFDAALTERLGELLPELAVVPVVHWNVSERNGSALEAAQVFDQVARNAPGTRVLVDAKLGGASGGLGLAFDWESARDVFAAQERRGLRVILAGGLRPDSVARAIGVLKPWGVDVVSGVEREPGRKDFEKLRSFLENAREAVKGSLEPVAPLETATMEILALPE